MSETFLFTVVDAFALSGRPGPVLVPGFLQSASPPTMRIGAQIRLVTPSGESIETLIAGFERISYGRKPPRDKVCTPITLPANISKEQVPAGTEVFLITTKFDATENAS
ncbi:MAG: hypothetical protein ACREPB_03315 [Arenimonas sp.]